MAPPLATPAAPSPVPRTPSTAASSAADSTVESAWQVRFGFWDDTDVLYNTLQPPKKPRVPSPQLDSDHEWAKRMVPTSSDGFLGNPSATQCLTNLQSGDQNPLTNFIVSGGECTGKMAFISLLKRALLTSRFDPPCAFGAVNAKHFDEKSLLLKIEDFVRRVDPRKSASAFLVIEHFEAVSPSAQQHLLLPILQDANAKSVFFIFQMRPDANKVAEQAKQRSLRVHLLPLKPMLVRTKLLHICAQEKIGFTRAGLEALLEWSGFKLLPSMERLRHVFQRHFFLSLANVQKTISEPSFSSKLPQSTATKAAPTPAPPPFPLSVLEMSEPLRRCKKCTLVPPCSHVTMETLLERVARVRGLYPHQRGDGADAPQVAVCPSFLATGICRNIQTLGRCRYAHPMHAHAIDTAQIVKRCRAHTLPLPCSHCANVSALQEQLRGEIRTCMALETQLQARRKQHSDLEMSRFLLARDRSKSVKWGAAKRELDEKLVHVDAALADAQREIDALSSGLLVSQARRDQLEADNERRISHGTLSQARRA